VAIDLAVTHGESSNETGIIVAALGANGHAYIGHDYSGRFSPAEWAKLAVRPVQWLFQVKWRKPQAEKGR
jgi:hypothetical protein